MTEKQIVINNLLVNYYFVKSGDSAAQTVIFLHGWRAEGKIWAPVIRNLAESGKYNIFSLDFPGFGKSGKPKGPMTVGDFADIIEEFIKKVALTLNPSPARGEGNKVGQVSIIGHSFGGRVAIKLAAIRPELLKKIVLVNSAGIKSGDVKTATIKSLAKVLKPVFKLPLFRSMKPKIYKAIGSEDYLATPELTSTFLNVINEDLTPSLREIKTPTLLIWGGKDKDTPVSLGQTMQKYIENSRLLIYMNAGHFSFIDEPKAFYKDLVNFLDESAVSNK